MPPARVAEIGLAVLDALTAVGRAGLVHLDVKPDNEQPRRLYLDDALQTGVDVPNEAILFWQTVEPHHHDGGLRQDAIWVVEDADLTYWSKRAPRPCAPEGGDGFPPTYRL